MTILELQDALQIHFTCNIRGVTIQESTCDGAVFWEVTYRIFPKALGLSEWDVTTSVCETRQEAIKEALLNAPTVAIDYGVALNPIPR